MYYQTLEYKGYKYWVSRSGVRGAWAGNARRIGSTEMVYGTDYFDTPRQFGKGAKVRAKQIILARIEATEHRLAADGGTGCANIGYCQIHKAWHMGDLLAPTAKA